MISPERFVFVAFVVAVAGMLGAAIGHSINPSYAIFFGIVGTIIGIVVLTASFRGKSKHFRDKK